MSARSDGPRWPAWGHDHNWAWRLDSIEPFCTVAADYLRQGHLRAVRILDSDLNLYKVGDARLLGRAGIFGWRPGYKGTYLRVEPALEFQRRLDLAAAKRYVLDFVSGHPGVYESGMSRAELSSAVAIASSAEELFAVLG